MHGSHACNMMLHGNMSTMRGPAVPFSWDIVYSVTFSSMYIKEFCHCNIRSCFWMEMKEMFSDKNSQYW